jgi:lipopolysaccharide transport system ATP-binding protein
MSHPVIQVENLCKDYVISHQGAVAPYQTLRDSLSNWLKRSSAEHQTSEIFHALKNVSFDVKQGEVLGVIGRNGAGKSTLLKILSRITEPSSGRIKLKGRVASLLEVGTGFHPELSGRENIFLNGAILGMRQAEIRKKFDEIVDFAEVEKFLDTPVKRYSSGMYVRLAFAVAAHLEPEILIVDEVLAVGDAAFQKKCFGKMNDVANQEGRTILFVSHQLKSIEALCTQAIQLQQGQLVKSGAVHEVITSYIQDSTLLTNSCSSFPINEELILESLSVNPNPVQSSEPLNFHLQLKVLQDCELHDLHLYFYNLFEDRIAIIDLRSDTGSRLLKKGVSLSFSGTVANLPLVEGDYPIGFCLRTNRYFKDYYDLIRIKILPPAVIKGVTPYPAEYLGTTLLQYEFEAVLS